MYEVHVFVKEVFEEILPTSPLYELRLWNFRSQFAKGQRIFRFKSEDSLLYFVRSFDTSQGNKFLSATMCNKNDNQRFLIQPDTRIGFLVKLGNKIIDLRVYTEKLNNFDKAGYEKKVRLRRNEAWQKKEEHRNKVLDRAKKLREGKFYWNYYRRIRTTQERKFASDPIHSKFVRGRRSFSSLVNAYDDLYFHREKTWKARSKYKNQWLINKNSHYPTIKYDKRNWLATQAQEEAKIWYIC